MNVDRIVNPHRLSNTYIVTISDSEVLLIDVGNFDQTLLTEWLVSNNKTLTVVILTHEHADHCVGLLELQDKYSYELYCSLACGQNIGNSRHNFSHYLEDIETFELSSAFTPVSNGQKLVFGQYEFKIYETPGHSPGGICIVCNDLIFTGDTLLNGRKTPLSFPHSSKVDYEKSIGLLKKTIEPGMIIYPGHESSFVFSSWENSIY